MNILIIGLVCVALVFSVSLVVSTMIEPLDGGE